MYSRIITYQKNSSFFLFGPRGTGKSTWLKATFPQALYLDLLKSSLFNDLLAQPQRLEEMVPRNFDDWVIIDEVQKIPELLNEVHRLIEDRKLRFILTGSSARKLKKKEVNLLAGRALTSYMHPLTSLELKENFSLSHSLKWGHLPSTFTAENPQEYLESYVATYLKEEVQQEGLTRNLGAFTRFLETASFSQGSIINYSAVARDCAVHRKVVENYFSIAEDLLISRHLPVFLKKTKRKLIAHPKFYFFDVGVYRTLRPKGPLDVPEEIDGAALETLLFQELRAMNDYLKLGYQMYYWRTASNLEVDFVLYGEKGIRAIEVKRTNRIRSQHLNGLKAFLEDYPTSKAYCLYGGDQELFIDNKISVVPVNLFLKNPMAYL